MSSKNGTPLTVEFFSEEILPRIEEVIDQKFREYQEKNDLRISTLENKFQDLERKFHDLEIKMLAFEERVISEIKSVNEELIIIRHLYESTDERIDIIDKQLDVSTVMDE